ncbi:FAD dependent oxidoreductase [Solidesulfovibrio carbinoliphilus subsp. oakridgensis]|uniref:FAD dependent oxidoreductase n=1 Tax=Solidesulfovibrio carbinoliphilus subsp. oakridgensis TaxID=694327 RepID=G7Q490_9BACT|nr:FAD-dependent oxidoreductase [Solidesulfovibrio carbinoliphilus]EHJ46958.1 FAD dependent oxidoreductase [Solidesulfovibrio carbinoliphilus subsp. oakridgensis]
MQQDQPEPRASLWMATADMPFRDALAEDLRVDACIVGAGVAGLMTAYELVRQGRSVAVLDDAPRRQSLTWRTSAHLSCALDDRFEYIERVRGEKEARLAAASHGSAIDRLEAVALEEAIACEFTRVDGYLFKPPADASDILDKELAAAHRAGLVDVALLPRAPLPSFDTGPCLIFPRQAQFHPLKFLAGLGEAVERRGGRLFFGTRVRDVAGGSPVRVTTTSGRTVTAGAVVVATNTPVTNRVLPHTKQAAYSTYVIGAPVSKGAVPPGLYWDTLDPYHYVRLGTGVDGAAGETDILVVGGEDHKTGQVPPGPEPYQLLEVWARKRFPMMGQVAFRWTGQVLETFDGLGYIGKNPTEANVYIATGDSGHGLTHGAIAGMLLSDLILGRSNAWTELYSPARQVFHGGAGIARWLGENLNVTRQTLDWISPGEVATEDRIAPGTGAVVRKGWGKEAVWRDAAGGLHRQVANCTHMKCIVHWNPWEKSWDCPCHGSRFDEAGRVLHGPANRNLEATSAEGGDEA